MVYTFLKFFKLKLVSDFLFVGIRLSSLPIKEAVKKALNGGLILAPSGPGLAALDLDLFYRDALNNSEINLADSGLAILLMRFLGLGKLPRTSGLGFLQSLLNEPELKKAKASFWIMPNQASLCKNMSWLAKQNIHVPDHYCYLAPVYPRKGCIEDSLLLSTLEIKRPRFIFVCVGSGPQEKLGFWLKQNLSYSPSIICIGAAIGFLSGDQVKIPLWADRLCLGWLIRCLNNPTRFIPRYLKAFRLVYLAFRYRDKAPQINIF